MARPTRCWGSGHGHWRRSSTRVGVGSWSNVRVVWITTTYVYQCARAARLEPREVANVNGPTRRAGPIVQTALAGYSARAPCPHPASQSHPSPGRLPARRSRSQSAMVHREANGRVPLVPASRTEIGNRRSSDAARAALPSRSDAESMFSGRQTRPADIHDSLTTNHPSRITACESL